MKKDKTYNMVHLRMTFKEDPGEIASVSLRTHCFNIGTGSVVVRK